MWAWEVPLVQFFGKVLDAAVVVLRPVPMIQTVLLVVDVPGIMQDKFQ